MSLFLSTRRGPDISGYDPEVTTGVHTNLGRVFTEVDSGRAVTLDKGGVGFDAGRFPQAAA
ncbi:hypothetical protein [Nocardia pseudovaccinii]|uniref:hypothetical protein n=1 Tax=Nocardia pseudovaccinii TaxID=189540 RepID=UPI0007A39530|nr:hypothetical protein [Nocardia pseudovaccinii]